MSIRPMTSSEIVLALRRSAAVCLEKGRRDWYSNEICMADGTYDAARFFDDMDCLASGPDHAANFLLMCAEATNA